MEILEQAFKSYLKNVEGCSLVQTNWTPSPIQMDALTKQDIEKVEKIASETKNSCPLNIFKNSNDTQFIKQCEIDVVGVKTEIGHQGIYLFDTAFHKNGLGYDDPVATVIKKLLRAAIIGSLFFKGFNLHVGFLAPKSVGETLKEIQNNIPTINKILKNNGIDATIEVYIDTQFATIINDLIALKGRINDTDDIFMRAVQLLDFADLGAKQPTSRKGGQKTGQDVGPITTIPTAEPSNKAIVISAVEDLINRGKIDATMFANLRDKTYTSKTFKISSFPFFEEASNITAKDQCRYYPRVFFPVEDGIAYRLTNQWRGNKNIDLFKAWYESLK